MMDWKHVCLFSFSFVISLLMNLDAATAVGTAAAVFPFLPLAAIVTSVSLISKRDRNEAEIALLAM